MLKILRNYLSTKSSIGPEPLSPPLKKEVPPAEVVIDNVLPFHVSAHIRNHEGFPIIDWEAANRWVEELGQSALQNSAWGMIERAWSIVQILLQAGADPNSTMASGWSSLHIAARNGDAEIVRALIQHGANVTARLPDGNTALRWAQIQKHTDIEKILKEAGA